MGSNPTPCKICFFNWLQWRNRLAHGTYRQYKEICRGCEFEPHLEQDILLLYNTEWKGKINPPRPGIEPGPSTWQAEILTTRLSRNWYYESRTNLRSIISFFYKHGKNSFEPDLNQRPMDIWHRTTTVHRSTNWAIEGWIQGLRCNDGITLIGWWWPWNIIPPRTGLIHTEFITTILQLGDVAQMVERSLSMWEVRGSIPRVSKTFFTSCTVSPRG